MQTNSKKFLISLSNPVHKENFTSSCEHDPKLQGEFETFMASIMDFITIIWK